MVVDSVSYNVTKFYADMCQNGNKMDVIFWNTGKWLIASLPLATAKAARFVQSIFRADKKTAVNFCNRFRKIILY